MITSCIVSCSLHLKGADLLSRKVDETPPDQDNCYDDGDDDDYYDDDDDNDLYLFLYDYPERQLQWNAQRGQKS